VAHENRIGVLTCVVLLRGGRWGRESRGVLLTLVYMITRFVLAVVTIRVRREASKDAHQGRLLRPPLHDPSEVIDMTARIHRRKTVTGLISEYRRAV
jgi:hypothetical protein